MDKKSFLAELRKRLAGLPQGDIEDRLGFYAEMIDDRVEEGMSEEEAVRQIGVLDEVAKEIIAETPLTTLVKEKVKTKRRLRAWEIVLLAVGSPIWLSLLIVAAAVILVLYVSFWAGVIALWACGGALVGCAVGGVAALVGFCIMGNVWTGLALLGAGLFLAGMSIFWFFGCGKMTCGYVWLTKRILRGIKLLFVGRRNEA